MIAVISIGFVIVSTLALILSTIPAFQVSDFNLKIFNKLNMINIFSNMGQPKQKLTLNKYLNIYISKEGHQYKI